jgi:DNA invertase Pin-like site-specific DNA recombinase
MVQAKWISYLRVSTGKQGRNGLGIEAQRSAVEQFLNGGKLIKEYVEVESGKREDRPKLAEAIQSCRAYKAKLVIASMDRLSHNARFLLGLKEAGVDFVAADNPDTNKFTVGIRAMVAEEESRLISERTKAALAAAKRRGIKLGGYKGKPMLKRVRKLGTEAIQKQATLAAQDIAPIIADLRKAGKTTLRAIADGLNDQGIPTARGNGQWSATQVARVLDRIGCVYRKLKLGRSGGEVRQG